MKLEDHLKRCDEEGDCLIWQGGVTSAGQPICRIDGKNTMLRTALFNAKGEPLRNGYRIATTCECRRCLNPAHIVAMSISAIVKRSHKRRGMQARIKIAMSKRAGSPMNGRTDEAIARVAAGEKKKDVAKDIGVSASAISLLTLGKSWQPFGNLFPGVAK